MTTGSLKSGILNNIPLVMLGLFAILFVGMYIENKKQKENE
jgi:hypothetical protein